mmetsp:Transcript_8185/g.16945  ORF Transcript_8185/g.16945 Transcript_8185/m.16945 type:complete len:330 (+) Transcript_8185:230-1219(+)
MARAAGSQRVGTHACARRPAYKYATPMATEADAPFLDLSLLWHRRGIRCNSGSPDESINSLEVGSHLRVLGECLDGVQHVMHAFQATLETILRQDLCLHLQHELLVLLSELRGAFVVGALALAQLSLELLGCKPLPQLLLHAQQAFLREGHRDGVHVELNRNVPDVKSIRLVRLGGLVMLLPPLQPIQVVWLQSSLAVVFMIHRDAMVGLVRLPYKGVNGLDVGSHLRVPQEGLDRRQHIGHALQAGFKAVLREDGGLHLEDKLLVLPPELHRALAMHTLALKQAPLEVIIGQCIVELVLQSQEAVPRQRHRECIHVDLDARVHLLHLL